MCDKKRIYPENKTTCTSLHRQTLQTSFLFTRKSFSTILSCNILQYRLWVLFKDSSVETGCKQHVNWISRLIKVHKPFWSAKTGPIIIPQTHQNKSREISIIQPSACDKESSRISLKSTGVKGKASISIRVSLCFPFFDLFAPRFGNSQKMYIPGIWFIKFPFKFRVLLKFVALLPRSLEIIIIKPIENFPAFFSNPSDRVGGIWEMTNVINYSIIRDSCGRVPTGNTQIKGLSRLAFMAEAHPKPYYRQGVCESGSFVLNSV